MATDVGPQPRVFTLFDLLALIVSGGFLVCLTTACARGGGLPGLLGCLVLSVVLIPVIFLAAWYGMIAAIVCLLWLFSFDRDVEVAATRDDPIFPKHWWDFRPFLVIGAVTTLWAIYGIPVLQTLPASKPRDALILLILSTIIPFYMVGLAARRWIPATIRRRFVGPCSAVDATSTPEQPKPPPDV